MAKLFGRALKRQKACRAVFARPNLVGLHPPKPPCCRKFALRKFATNFAAEVNVATLNVFESGSTVDAVSLVEVGILKNVLEGVRILGGGELSKKLTVRAQGFTATAKAKIEEVGGVAEVI